MTQAHPQASRTTGVPCVSVPGNLLVTGEYVITEEEGRGVACAIAPRVTAWIEDSGAELRVEGRTPTGLLEWRPDSRGSTGNAGEGHGANLLERIVPFLLDHATATPRGRVVIDSEAFFSPSGRKLGFGSSAAVTVALTALTCAAPEVATHEILDLAVQAHRHAQGGRGSGYDVVASLLGGVGVFTGGEHPRWKPVDGWWLDDAALLPGSSHTNTVNAVQRHREWSIAHPDVWRRLRLESEAATDRLVEAETWPGVRAAVQQARAVGEEIGRAISVAACIDQVVPSVGSTDRTHAGENRGEEDRDEPVCKAVGAGAELALCLGISRNDPASGGSAKRATGAPEVRRLQVEHQGLIWEIA